MKNFESNVGIILTFFPLKPEAVFEDMPYFALKDIINHPWHFALPFNPDETHFTSHGLCCGFVKVNKKLDIGQTLFLQDNRRTIRVRVVKDIRPDRTARRPINEMV